MHKEFFQMISRAALFAGLFAAVMATTSCGDSVNGIPVTPVAPTGPSSLSDLLLPRLGGNWYGEFILNGVAGGTGPAVNAGVTGCDGASFAQVLGEKNEYTLSITQSGSDLTAKMVSAFNGLACEYTGRVGSEQTFVLHAEQCTQKALNLACQNGNSRVLDLVGSSVTARFDDPINPRVISGTAAHTYNVTGSGTVGSALVATQSFQSLTRR
ncbi:MAG TPA: hypothetical protein VFD69_04375 [Vicinamibacterales bacterium]|nr:hypothetical protein [Vicinamibacterales bacterium]